MKENKMHEKGAWRMVILRDATNTHAGLVREITRIGCDNVDS